MRVTLGTSPATPTTAADWNPVPFPGKIQICPANEFDKPEVQDSDSCPTQR